jgi:hypothetical protein
MLLTPIRIIEELTGKEYGFNTIGQMAFGSGAIFNGPQWSPGVYLLINTGSGVSGVVLFGQSFSIPANSRWRFMAHADLESINWLGGAPPVATPT